MRKPPLLKPSSTADRVANILRDRILGMAENAYMGSEADIAAEIGVSMPTLRQASRMLEYEELLVVKPGKGGGYFTRRPTIETAIKSASQYLSAKDLISNASFMDAADSVVVPMLIGAVKCEDVALIKKLEAFIDAFLAVQNFYVVFEWTRIAILLESPLPLVIIIDVLLFSLILPVIEFRS